jgi:hypothetical protein
MCKRTVSGMAMPLSFRSVLLAKLKATYVTIERQYIYAEALIWHSPHYLHLHHTGTRLEDRVSAHYCIQNVHTIYPPPGPNTPEG